MKRNRPRYLSIGTISEGTLRDEDLIPAWISALEDVKLSRADRKTLEAIRKASDVDEDSDYWQEQSSEDLDTLQDMAGNYAPPFCYAGSIESDGACIGVWISHDSLDEALRDGEIIREHDALTTDARYRLFVNDHGNMTLRYVNGREVWAVV